MQNPWDALSEKFKGSTSVTDIDPDAADNILIAWPPILEYIAKHFSSKKDISILDYGCGTGIFCEKLYSLGYANVTGVDSSAAMVALARKQYGEHVQFVQGSTDIDLPDEKVDAITGIMVFQFVEDISTTFERLVGLLKSGGVLLFALHSPATVIASLQSNDPLFSGFESATNPSRGRINLGNLSIPIFIRTASDYDTLLQPLNMKKVLEVQPKYTKEFLEKFHPPHSEVPHFLILGYQKI